MEDKKGQKPNNPLKQIAVLTGVGIQMGVTIYLFVLLGKWLDATYNTGGKAFLIIFTLLGVGVSLYVVLKQLSRIQD
ncbi:AtpZ/AtpI family protein [Snuella lapsa]|uniref:AtpZ/AtpI family protein n=1 Tax=Snuella lapsa TaxID=870481 RepID=A0ABP6XEJ9_9FLAO